MKLKTPLLCLILFLCIVSIVSATNPNFKPVSLELRQNLDNTSEYSEVKIDDMSEYPSVSTSTPVLVTTTAETTYPANLTNTIINMPIATPWLAPLMLAFLLMVFGVTRGRSAIFIALVGYGGMYYLGMIPPEFTWIGTFLLPVGMAMLVWDWLRDSPRSGPYDLGGYSPSRSQPEPAARVEPTQQDARRELDSILENPAQLTNTDIPVQPEEVSPETSVGMSPPKSRWEQLE